MASGLGSRGVKLFAHCRAIVSLTSSLRKDVPLIERVDRVRSQIWAPSRLCGPYVVDQGSY